MPEPRLELEISTQTALALLGEERELELTVKPYAGLRASAQLANGKIFFKASEGWQYAPEEARVGLALDLFLRIFRKKPTERHQPYLQAYRAFSSRESAALLHESLRQMKGRASGTTPKGNCYNLEHELDMLLIEYADVFSGLSTKPKTAWSREHSRARLGFHDSAFNTLVVSKALDSPHVPAFVMRYVLYHELLHVKHKVLYERGESLRRTVHPRAFKQDERKFREYAQAIAWLRRNRL